MTVLVSDVSVLIDLEHGSLLEAAFQMPFEFAVPDVLYELELKAYRSGSSKSDVQVQHLPDTWGLRRVIRRLVLWSPPTPPSPSAVHNTLQVSFKPI